MKKVFMLTLFMFCLAHGHGQNTTVAPNPAGIDRNNLQIRPNSRDYLIVKRDNNHQRVIQNRKNAMLHRRQATLNRNWAMEKRRSLMQQRMIRQQENRQRLNHQRGIHR